MNMYIFFIVLYSYECKGMNLAVVDVVVIFFIIFFWLALSSLFDGFKIVFIVSLVCIDDNNDYRGIDKHQKRAVIGLVNRARTFVNKMSKIHWTKNTIRRKLKWFFSRRIDKYSNKRNQQMCIVVRFFMASTDLTFIWWPYLVHFDEFFFRLQRNELVLSCMSKYRYTAWSWEQTANTRGKRRVSKLHTIDGQNQRKPK